LCGWSRVSFCAASRAQGLPETPGRSPVDATGGAARSTAAAWCPAGGGRMLRRGPLREGRGVVRPGPWPHRPARPRLRPAPPASPDDPGCPSGLPGAGPGPGRSPATPPPASTSHPVIRPLRPRRIVSGRAKQLVEESRADRCQRAGSASQDLGGQAVLRPDQAEQDVLRADLTVPEPEGLTQSQVQGLPGPTGDAGKCLAPPGGRPL
jgi:hypothetical protein